MKMKIVMNIILIALVGIIIVLGLTITGIIPKSTFLIMGLDLTETSLEVEQPVNQPIELPTETSSEVEQPVE